MDNIETRILNSLQGPPKIFFAEDVRLRGVTMKTIRFALAGLANRGDIVRLAWGVYYKPALSEYSLKRELPSPLEIAEAVARRGNLILIPHGSQSARALGLTHDQGDTYMWFSNGATRQIGLAGGKSLKFIHSDDSRMFAFKNTTMRDVCNGLRYIGETKVGAYEKDAVRVALKDVPWKDIQGDLRNCPEWVREIVLEACEGKEEKIGE